MSLIFIYLVAKSNMFRIAKSFLLSLAIISVLFSAVVGVDLQSIGFASNGIVGPKAVFAKEHEQTIKWFKEQMEIAPQYQEQRQDILGMSWPHFLVMSFLITFFVIALIAVYVRNRRTRQILTQLLKETSNEP